MEKQHNRGQDGAGIASVKLNIEPGHPFLHRIRSNNNQPIADIFSKINDEVKDLEKYQPDIIKHPGLLKGHISVMGELLLGHLRYGTQGKNNVEFCHPFIKRNTIPARNLALAGNFNLVNTDELFGLVNIDPGEFQKQSDLAAMMEVIHHFQVQADEASPGNLYLVNTDELFGLVNIDPGEFQKQSDLAAMMEVIHHFQVKADEAAPGNLDLVNLLRKAVALFDGGFTVGGLIGNGDSFVFRDAHGIRPAYYYINDDVVVAASERAAIRTVFNVGENEVMELMPGKGLIVRADGHASVETILEPRERRACSFERIYFSRGSDEKIYRERIALGYNLSGQVLGAINHDLKNTIFSFIPNTAEVAFYGLWKGMDDYLESIKIQRILSWGKDISEEKLVEMISRKIRVEKVAIKDVKMRTFITEDVSRNEMVQHVYDVTYGTVHKGIDTLVVIDDSIVRGTTLQESIIRMLARLEPKKIIIVSSAPQIRYPDCYGIDMSKLGDFIAFKAAVELMKERGKEACLQELYDRCKELQRIGQLHTENVVQRVYKSFTPEEISDKIAELITPPEIKTPVQVIYQTIEALHKSCPTNTGDWYFTGDRKAHV